MPEHSTVETVAQLMNDLRYAGGGTYTLFVTNGQLQLTNKKDLPPYCIVIEKFTSVDINKGLSSQRWNYLSGRILNLIHGGKLK